MFSGVHSQKSSYHEIPPKRRNRSSNSHNLFRPAISRLWLDFSQSDLTMTGVGNRTCDLKYRSMLTIYHCVTAAFKFLVDPLFKFNLSPLFEGKMISPWITVVLREVGWKYFLLCENSTEFLIFSIFDASILYIVWPITVLRLISTSQLFSARDENPFSK